jgi:hypothetical protein
MQPDAQRQWFVYYKEKETGPISEKELHSKIKSGDLDASAYVFTEGMGDWALVSDTPVLAQASSTSPTQPADDVRGFSDEAPQSKSVSAAGGAFQGSQGTQSRAPQSSVQAPQPAAQAPAAKGQTQSGVVGAFSAPSPGTQSGVRDAGQFKNIVTNTKSVNLQAPKVDTTKAVKVGVPTKAKSGGLSKVDLKDPAQRKRLLVLLVLVVVVVAGGAIATGVISVPGLNDLAGPVDTGKEPLPNKVPEQPKTTANSKSPETGAPDAKAGEGSVQTDKAGAPAQLAGDWESALQQFRAIKDPKGSVAMIARASIGAKFPIFVGSLSPLLTDIRELAVAVYPDNEKNLMAMPRLWYFRVPVHEGWFTIGPLSNGGAALPAGRYVITMMSQGKAFDDQVIDVGTWPAEAELAKIRSQLDQERVQAAAKEKADFGPRLKAAVALEKQLLVRSVDARKQKKGRSAWTSFSRAWYKDNDSQLRAANALATGPTFYPDAQRKLTAYLEALRGLYETYEIVSKEGPKALKKFGRKNEEQQRLFIARLNTDLSGLGNSLKTPDKIEAFKLKPDLVKDTLKSFEQSAKELTQ